jgi:glycerophosphoryl diester phosphodiesterase
MSFQHTGKSTRPLIIGHRGGAGPALENSLSAFRNAAGGGEFGCDAVELDIHVTSDREFVVHHDARLATGAAINQMSLAELKEAPLADGSTIPTLAEVLSITATLMTFVEVKELPKESDQALLTLLSASNSMGGIQVHSFDHRIVARLKQKAPSLLTGVLSSSYPIDPIGPVKSAGAATLWQSSEMIDRALVEACKAGGVALIAWTVNSREEASRLRSMGVMALCGDWPDRLRVPST